MTKFQNGEIYLQNIHKKWNKCTISKYFSNYKEIANL